MALITCAGADVLRGAVHLPARGAWWASLVLDTPTLPSGKVTIAADGGFTLEGTIVPPSGVFLDAAHVSIIGGAGGLSTIVPVAAYEQAQLRDPLNAALAAAGESLSSTVSESVASVQLPMWSQPAEPAVSAIDALCYAAGLSLGQAVRWRVLDDGTVWLGSESWPSAQIPDGDDVLDYRPSSGRYIIGATTPSLLPGVNLDGVGKVVAVSHWLKAHEVRTWAEV